MEQLRKKSDEICSRFGLEVLKPYQKPKQRTMNQREYRVALRGDSKKLRLMNAIDYAVINSRSKEKFIENMKRIGYGVKWIDSYKYITYTTPDGQRFRDNRLFGEKFLKENMEDIYGLKAIATDKPNTNNYGQDSECAYRADSAKIFDAETGAVQSYGGIYLADWRRHCEKYGFDSGTANAEELGQLDYQRGSEQDVLYSGYRAERDDLGAIFNGATVEEPDEGDSGENLFGDSIAQRGTHDYSENENQVVHSWSDIADGSVNLAADLAMIIDDEVEDDWQRKQVVERKKRPKSRPKSGFKMKM